MILTDREIQTAIGSKAIVIDPPPAERAYASTSVDLTLDPILSIFKAKKTGIQQTIDPTVDNFNAEDIIKELTDNFTIPDAGYSLGLRELVLAYTAEYVDLRAHPRTYDSR